MSNATTSQFQLAPGDNNVVGARDADDISRSLLVYQIYGRDVTDPCRLESVRPPMPTLVPVINQFGLDSDGSTQRRQLNF
ncbi:hypothetical protein M413DRAFT_261505 [Hebeloma cylindrosporum]|uniref:Uncharacterized protein n=1 Tax=Hebeloma cylindrosporum TaxID=76867 RepID=A0A0C3CS71_HEBCY|nr:hypothetical protein M413DRAFT_261505 [Hebeloma cylindrosporum h7]